MWKKLNSWTDAHPTLSIFTLAVFCSTGILMANIFREYLPMGGARMLTGFLVATFLFPAVAQLERRM